LRQTALAAEIKKRLSNPVVLEITCQFGVSDGGLLAVTGLKHKAKEMIMDSDMDIEFRII
jgi:hypothetical protein